MVRVSRIEIRESAEQLKQLMHLQANAGAKERLQVLYWLKAHKRKTLARRHNW